LSNYYPKLKLGHFNITTISEDKVGKEINSFGGRNFYLHFLIYKLILYLILGVNHEWREEDTTFGHPGPSGPVGKDSCRIQKGDEEQNEYHPKHSYHEKR